MMDGEIRVTSTPGAGSAFTFTARFELAETGRLPLHGPVAELSGRRVLVAEPRDAAREALCRLLAAWGCRVRGISHPPEAGNLDGAAGGDGPPDLAVVAVGNGQGKGEAWAGVPGDPGVPVLHVHAVEDGRGCIEALLESDYDAVLMDIQMPRLSGFGTTRIIRGDMALPDLPVIALTARAMHGDEQRCLDAGMDDYIAKPIDRDRLLEVLGKYLRRAPGDAPAPAAEAGDVPRVRGAEAGDLRQLVERLGESLRFCDPVASESHVDALRRSSLQGEHPEGLAAIQRLVREYRFDEAGRALHRLTRGLS